jgi:fibronectin type 3 domain-containing protein
MTSIHRFPLWTKAAVTLLPALLLVSLPCEANVPVPTPPPPAPAGYCQTIGTELTNDLNAFNATLNTVWNGSTYPTLYAGNLPMADGNVGPSLSNSAHMTSVQQQLVELKAMGYKAVMIQVGFPILYQPFYTSQSQYQQYVNFYSQLASTIRSMGMKIIVENDELLSSDVQAGWTNTPAFFATLNWSQYMAARATMAATVAQVMQPDYLVLAEEPDSEATQSGQTNLNNPVDAAAMISAQIAAVRALGLPNVKLGAGFGSWTANLTDYISNYVALPLDYIDFHIYPINTENGHSLIGNALTITNAAAAAGKPVAMSETWLWKMEDSEWRKLTPDQYRSREPFAFWAPQNTLFLQTIQNLANYTKMLYQAPSEPEYFFAYQTYGGTTANGGAANCMCTTESCSSGQIMNTEMSLTQSANQQSLYTATGMSYYKSLVPASDTVPPSIPLNLTGSAVSTTANLSWTASTDNVGVAGYNILRNGVWIANSSQPSYQDTGLATSTTYNYQVQAFDLAGNTSLSSTTVSVATAYTLPPTAPASVAATAYATQGITVTWSAAQDPKGVSSYQVFRGGSPSSLVQVATVQGTTLSYKDSALAPSTTYYYGVKATQASYISAMSAIGSATTMAMPSAPAKPTATATSPTQVSLSWVAGSSGLPLAGFHIFRGTAPSNLSQVANRPTSPYTDVALTAGTTYYYAVQEMDTAGNVSPMSTTVSVATLAPPSAPTGVKATASATNQVSLSWAAGPSSLSLVGYHIFRGTTSSNLTLVASRPTSPYTDGPLTPGTKYFYAVQEVDAAGSVSAMSATVSVTTLALPSAPTSVKATANSNTQVTLSWTPAPSGMPILSYHIYRGTAPTSLALVAAQTTTSYTNASLTPNKLYYYAVQALDTGGNLSPMSATVSVTTPK